MENTFTGKNSIIDYLDPEKNPPTPLVELPNILNPFSDTKVRIFAKIMSATPLMNIKSWPAFNMINTASNEGRLEGVTKIIESSSGNTALSLSIIARAFGIDETEVIVSDTVPIDKLQMLQVFGTKVIVNREPMCPDADDPESGINIAKSKGRQKKYFNPGQYHNPANPGAHEQWTGKQIWEQTNGKITVFAATLGTTGTITGASKYLKSRNMRIQVIGAASGDDVARLGPRTKALLGEVGFNWKSVVNHVEEVDTIKSMELSLKLIRNGLMVGPSSGFNLLGLYQYLQTMIEKGSLDMIRNEGGEIHAVFVCPDGPFPYIDTYLTKLDPSNFPSIQNEELLTNSRRRLEDIVNKSEFKQFSISADTVYKEILAKKYKLTDGHLSNSTVLIDVRKPHDFDNFHIEGIKHIPYTQLEQSFEYYKNIFKNKRVIIFNCGLTDGSKYAVGLLREAGIEGYYVDGGMDRWTKNKYPVIDNRNHI